MKIISSTFFSLCKQSVHGWQNDNARSTSQYAVLSRVETVNLSGSGKKNTNRDAKTAAQIARGFRKSVIDEVAEQTKRKTRIKTKRKNPKLLKVRFLKNAREMRQAKQQ